MTIATSTLAPRTSTAVQRNPHARVTTRRVIASEWIKFRSLRSTLVTLAVTVAIVIGLGLLISSVVGNSTGTSNTGSNDPTAISLAGISLAALAVAVLGVLTTAGEYTTGSIRSTLSAVPTRLPVLWAKAVVVAVVTFAVMTATVLAAFLGGQAILAAAGHTSASLTDPGVLRAVLGSAVYLTGAALIGAAVGALVRNTAGAVASIVGALFVLPGLVGLLPNSWSDAIGRYLPSNAGGSFMTVSPNSAHLSPWLGLLVYAAYAVALLAAAAIMLKRRDS